MGRDRTGYHRTPRFLVRQPYHYRRNSVKQIHKRLPGRCARSVSTFVRFLQVSAVMLGPKTELERSSKCVILLMVIPSYLSTMHLEHHARPADMRYSSQTS